MAIEFQEFARQLAQATQAAFLELLARHPTEEFYSFALNSDEGAMTVCPAANTLAHLAAQPPYNQQFLLCFLHPRKELAALRLSKASPSPWGWPME